MLKSRLKELNIGDMTAVKLNLAMYSAESLFSIPMGTAALLNWVRSDGYQITKCGI